MIIEKYESKYRHLLASFDCGNPAINKYIHNELGTDVDGCVSYLLFSDEKKDALMGFYSIETGRLDQHCDDGQITPMGGTINISYLALDIKYQHTFLRKTQDGQNFYIGDYLLEDCENRIQELSSKVGISFITLYSSEDGYHMYHDRNDYVDFEDDMSTVVRDSDVGCKKLYKWLSDF